MDKTTLLNHIKQSYQEDIPQTDITTQTILHAPQQQTAQLISKDYGIFCGDKVIEAIWEHFDKSFEYTLHIQDGNLISAKDVLCTFKGSNALLLQVERVLLNYIQRLCGIASLTRQFVTELDNPNISILDTRKTTPTLREFEKYAVRVGRGVNHRHSLSDMILIKENHLSGLENEVGKEAFIPTLAKRLKDVKQTQNPPKIELEIETLDQLKTYDFSDVDYILLDNFSVDQIKEAANIKTERNLSCELEVSGNVTLETIGQYRHLPIQRISVGALTHSAKAFDLSLLIST